MSNYQLAPQADQIIRIKVVGVGGAGGHIVNRMAQMNIPHIQYAAINTDAKAIFASEAGDRLLIGKDLTGGLGTGGNIALGKHAAEGAAEAINHVFQNTDMLFLTAGLGGGAGTGALPVAARLAKDQGILTIAVVTLPFSFEGKERIRRAEDGLAMLKACVDALIVIPNDNLRKVSEEKLTFTNAFDVADRVLSQTVQNIIDLIQRPAYINTDFADVTAILRNAGTLHVGFASASGINRVDAVLREISHSILLNTSVTGATGILFCITASEELSLEEGERLSEGVRAAAAEDVNMIFGMDFDNTLGGSVQAMLLAVGMDKERGLL